jgi:hypothetical protein
MNSEINALTLSNACVRGDAVAVSRHKTCSREAAKWRSVSPLSVGRTNQALRHAVTAARSAPALPRAGAMAGDVGVGTAAGKLLELRHFCGSVAMAGRGAAHIATRCHVQASDDIDWIQC